MLVFPQQPGIDIQLRALSCQNYWCAECDHCCLMAQSSLSSYHSHDTASLNGMVGAPPLWKQAMHGRTPRVTLPKHLYGKDGD